MHDICAFLLVLLCPAMLYHVLLCHVMSCHVLKCHINTTLGADSIRGDVIRANGRNDEHPSPVPSLHRAIHPRQAEGGTYLAYSLRG